MATEINMPDLNEIIDKLINLDEKCRSTKTRSLQLEDKFIKCATDLSSLLPKVSDSTLFEFDDLWYYKENYSDVSGTKMCSEETVSYLIEKCIGPFTSLYAHEGCERACRIVDVAFLQLIEHSSEDTIRPTNDIVDTKITTIALMMMLWRSGLNVMRAIRILSVAFDRHRELVRSQIEEEKHKFVALFLWLKNLLVVPDSTSKKTNQMTSWLSRQVSVLLDNLDLSKMEFPNVNTTLYQIDNADDSMQEYINTYYHLKKEHYNSEFIFFVVKCLYEPYWIAFSFHFENLFNYFSSATTDDEKLMRIKDFHEGLKLFEERRSGQSGIPPMRIIFDLFHDCIEFITMVMWKTSQLKMLELCYASLIDTPYLSKGDKCSSYLQFKNKTSELMEKYFTISKDATVHEPSFTFAKIFYFKDFVKILKVMDIMHTAFLMYDEIFESIQDNSSVITEMFRPFSSSCKNCIKDFLKNSQFRGRSRWWFQYLLKKCPFLFLSYEHDSNMESLIKVVKGIEISQVEEELLFFAVDTKSYKKAIDFGLISLSMISFAVSQDVNEV